MLSHPKYNLDLPPFDLPLCQHIIIMEESQFDQLLHSQTAQQLTSLLKTQLEPSSADLIYLTPKNAVRLEKTMNSLKFKYDGDGFIFEPYRERYQIQYKQGLTPLRHSHFADQENHASQLFEETQRLIRRKIPKNVFMGFLLIQLIRKYSVSHFFIHLPDEIFLKCTDYRQIIHQPLDIFSIVYKIFRGDYATLQDFQLDMVAMIQNAKIYFFHHAEILTDVLRFEALFWHLYEIEIPKYVKALEEFRKETRFAKQEVRNAKKLKRFDKEEKLKLHHLINQQAPDVRAKISEYLRTNARKYLLDNSSISLVKIPSKYLREVEAMCQPLHMQSPLQEQRYYNAQQICAALKASNFNADDIYQGSDDD